MSLRQRSTLDNLLTLRKTDALVQKFHGLEIWRRGDGRAPRKPLLGSYAWDVMISPDGYTAHKLTTRKLVASAFSKVRVSPEALGARVGSGGSTR
jgi:hypothetical protein